MKKSFCLPPIKQYQNSILYRVILGLLIIFSGFNVCIGGNKVKVEVSKNQLNTNFSDSVIISFFLTGPATVNMSLINIYGGNKVELKNMDEFEGGWQQVVLHTDLMISQNPDRPSGLYYVELNGQYKNNTSFLFNSFQNPCGELVIAEEVKITGNYSKIEYSLPKFCMVRVRLGMKDGALLRSYNWTPQIQGNHIINWDGYDQTGEINVKGKFDMASSIVAYGLPETSISFSNEKNPVNYNCEAVYPENWNRFAALEIAKKPWNESYDMRLDYVVTSEDPGTIVINFPENLEKNKKLSNIFLENNEIYISVDGELYTENPDVNLSESYSISVPELSEGQHLIITNLIFGIDNDPFGNVATGVKEIIIK